jgi:hypothetical protein
MISHRFVTNSLWNGEAGGVPNQPLSLAICSHKGLDLKHRGHKSAIFGI